ncbi:MAG: helix-turn-helix domain-containing protein [Reichenbachiella sp.]|uniref:helix-turn-helix domain-containing protein n=1 Tax=Reichenbachiella sp. TaxID=2184521 RepID=UPI003298439E
MDKNLVLVNKQNGNLALKLFSFNDLSHFDHVQRHNYYSLIWIKKGAGKVKADFAEYHWESPSLLAFAPYQPFMLSTNTEIEGIALNFHPDFFCIHKHHEAVACHGVLFNNIYESPVLLLDEKVSTQFQNIVEPMKEEMLNGELAQYELLVSYLKIFLIAASRRKVENQPDKLSDLELDSEPFVLQNLKKKIEENFRNKHSASDYASLLNISAKALTKATKKYFNKTVTDLISERIIIEAKRELYLTDKQVKLIASELGYNDEYYFSRFFKNYTDVSPQLYRDTVGFNRASTL